MLDNYPLLQKSRVKAHQLRTKAGMDKYPSLMKAVDRSKELKKSIEFTKTGKEVKEGIMVKIAQLEGKLSALIASCKLDDADKCTSEDVPEPEVVNKPTSEPWEIRRKREKIDQLRAIHRNLKDNQKVKLTDYELAEYGL